MLPLQLWQVWKPGCKFQIDDLSLQNICTRCRIKNTTRSLKNQQADTPRTIQNRILAKSMVLRHQSKNAAGHFCVSCFLPLEISIFILQHPLTTEEVWKLFLWSFLKCWLVWTHSFYISGGTSVTSWIMVSYPTERQRHSDLHRFLN